MEKTIWTRESLTLLYSFFIPNAKDEKHENKDEIPHMMSHAFMASMLST